MINVTINGRELTVKEGTTILEAAEMVNIYIPTLCHVSMNDGKSVNCKGSCRVCVVEVVGQDRLQPACSYALKDGMKIITNSTKANTARKTILELLISHHPNDCLNCSKNLSCELQKLARDFGVRGIDIDKDKPCYEKDESTPIIRDMNKCILCRRCVTACNDVQNMNILTPINRSFNTSISTFSDKELVDSGCTYCGQCVSVCPTAALTERIDYINIPKLLDDKNKYVVAQIAPAVRVALCEEFGVTEDVLTTGKIVAALKMLNFNKVFDTNFSADLTVVEEANELVERISNNKLPMFTSCCPAWVRTVETVYPEYSHLLSSCKSPQQMFGAIAKSYLANKLSIDKERLLVVSIMPCIAKKYEASIEEMKDDVDIVITTREVSKLIKEAGIDICNMEEEDFDNPLGESTGAGILFGATGGVMEASLRTAYEIIVGEELKDVEFKEVRGLEGVKEASILLKDKILKVAAISSLANAKEIMNEIKDGNIKYDFIEVMACPGGCINGAGQPFIKSEMKKVEKRMNAIYKEDSKKEIRKSHENPEIKILYNDFLGKPNSEISHKLLHRNYKKMGAI